MMFRIPSRASESKQLGLKFFYTGKMCKYGHLSLRKTKGGECITCVSIRNKSEETRQKSRELAKRPEQKLKKRANYLKRREAGLTKISAKKYQRRHKEKVKVVRQRYRKTEKYKVRAMAYAASRKDYVKERTPLWLTSAHKEQIADIYKEKHFLQKELNETFHVDHIVPLRNPKVCGLHVPWNLRVITARENSIKSNKWITSTEPSWPNIPQLKLIQ